MESSLCYVSVFIQRSSWNSASRASRISVPQTCSRNSAKRGIAQRRARARLRQIDGDGFVDARWPALEHDHPMAEQHRFLDRVGDEDHRGRPLAPKCAAARIAGSRGSARRPRRTARPSAARSARPRARAPGRSAAACRRTSDRDRRFSKPPSPTSVMNSGTLRSISALRRAGHAQPIGDVVEYRLPRKQPEMLEHHGDARRSARSTRWPPTQISPASSGNSPSMQRSSVVLPQPDGPTMATISRSATSKSMLRENFERAVALAEPSHANARFARQRCSRRAHGWRMPTVT